jgi:VanZ like family
LTIPVLFLVLAATALPIEFRPLGEAQMSFEVDDVLDIVVNILGYLPVGLVLGAWGWLRAVLIAGVLSTGAETSQLVMMHRDPSLTDIVANLAGAALGALARARWRMHAPTLLLHRGTAVRAALLACVPVLYVWSMAGVPVNTRGATSPGTLEASWQLDTKGGQAVLDASGQGLVGTFRASRNRVRECEAQRPCLTARITSTLDARRPWALPGA